MFPVFYADGVERFGSWGCPLGVMTYNLQDNFERAARRFSAGAADQKLRRSLTGGGAASRDHA